MTGKLRALSGLMCLFWAMSGLLAAETPHSCAAGDLEVQVMGSGGPIPDLRRASSGYLVWLDGRSRVMVDAGGGTFLNFSRSGAQVEDLWFLGLSHFHTDHSAEFPAFIKGAYFSERSAVLPVAGPRGSQLFPGLRDFLAAMLGEEQGAFRYLSGFLSGSERFALDPLEIDHTDRAPHRVLESPALKVSASGVPHGIVPALAYRLDFANQSVVFASDQNGSSDAFVEFAQGADLLVMHMAIPENATGGALQLHAKPSQIGKIAQRAGARTLLLSHFMRRSLDDLDAGLAQVRKHYPGPVILAEDMLCVRVPDKNSWRPRKEDPQAGK